MSPEESGRPDAVVRVVARMLLGPTLMVAAALIAKGYAEVGDGFGAGVVVSLAIALAYIALGGAGAEAALPMLRHAPKLAVGGLLLALASGFFPLLLGEPRCRTARPRASTSSRSARWSCSPRCCWTSGSSCSSWAC